MTTRGICRTVAWMAVSLSLLLTACSDSPTSASSTSDEPSPVEQAQEAVTEPAVPGAGSTDLANQKPQLAGAATVELKVAGGTVVMDLDGDKAPVTAGNFVDLVQRKVYDGATFHRVEPGFVVQGGDPLSKDPQTPVQSLGTGSFVDPETGQPRYIPLEILPEAAEAPVYGQPLKEAGVTNPPVLTHQRGAVAMARSMLPNSASSQFYVTLDDTPFLDGSYAVFGYVREGMDIIDKIQIGDRIDSMTVVSGAENLQQ